MTAGTRQRERQTFYTKGKDAGGHNQGGTKQQDRWGKQEEGQVITNTAEGHFQSKSGNDETRHGMTKTWNTDICQP